MKKLTLSVIALLAMTVSAMAGDAKYIFYFIGDGMGNGHVMGAYQYNRIVNQMEQPLLLTSLPITGQSTTHSASSPVTDSAAGGTALATGTKTLNGMIGMAPDTTAVRSIADILHDNGYGVGIVTSVAANDATPAAFYAHQPKRSMYYEIATEAASSDFEFIAGSGFKGLDKAQEQTLWESFTRNNVTVGRGAESLKGVQNRKVVLLNNDTLVNWTVGSTIDSIPGGLTLPVMTAECLNHLKNVSPDRFFMMVEGGNIDYGGHSNDGGTVIKEIIKFDEALSVAYDFYLAHPDETLIVITADHDTGGMSVGNQYLHYNAKLNFFDAQRVSKDRFADQVKAIIKSRRIFTWEDMREYLEDNLGFWKVVPLSESETEALHESFINTFEKQDGREQVALYNKYPQFVVDVFKMFNDACGIGWTTSNHTGNPVPVFAVGVGAEQFKSLNDNIHIPAKILNASTINK